MKRIKRLFAILTSIVMAFGVLSITVFAANDTIVSVTGLEEGDEVKYYQVLTWSEGAGWKVTDDFAAIKADTVNFPDDGDPTTDRDAEIVNILTTANEFTEARARAIAGALAATATAKFTETVGSGKTSTYTLPTPANTADLGMYLVLVTAGNPGFVYNPIFVSADFKDDNDTETIPATEKYSSSSVAKKTVIEVLKKTEDSNSAIDTAISSYVGQEVTFHVDTTVPVFLDSYKSVSFVIDDVIKTTGIEYTKESVTVKLDNTAVPDAYNATEFELVDNDKGYTITFKEDYLRAVRLAVPVHIEYKGKITNTAEFNINEDDNEVTVTYTNGPNGEKAALRDRTNHYTFSIGAKALGESDDKHKTWELVKVAADADGNPIYDPTNITEWTTTETNRHPLAGAEFGLYTDAACTTLFVNDLYPSGATFITTADGIITFKGLEGRDDPTNYPESGTYYLKEISAPAGYVKDTRIVKIEIIPTYSSVTVPDTVENGVKVKGYEVKVLKSYKVVVNGVSVYDEAADQYKDASGPVETNYSFNNDGPHTASIDPVPTKINDGDLINVPGTELPDTGGIGTTLFYIFGGVMVLGAGILLVSRQRMMN